MVRRRNIYTVFVGKL